MNENIDQRARKKARLPHNIFMLNLALVHLLMTPAVIAFEIGLWGMSVPLLFSLLIMAYTYQHSKIEEVTSHNFIRQHWLLALKRYRLLLISYALTAVLLGTGSLLAMASPDPNMQDILETVFIRIAIMPVLLMVMVCFYLESSALGMVTKKSA